MAKPKPKKKYRKYKPSAAALAAVAGTRTDKIGRVYKTKPNGKADTKPVVWTEEVVLKELQLMLKEVREREDYVYIGQLLLTREISRKYVARWRTQYAENEMICSTMDAIEQILETRVAVGGLKGTFNAHFTKFHLINNHDWREKSEVENTHKIPTLGSIFDEASKRRDEEEEK